MIDSIISSNRKNRKKNVVVFGAHPDDFEVGCSGTILKYLDTINLKIYVMSDRYEDGKLRNLREKDKSFRILGLDKIPCTVYDIPTRIFHDYRSKIRNILYDIATKTDVDVVFTPPIHDIHQDHIVLADEVIRLFREKSIFGYEVIRSGYDFMPNMHVKLPVELVNLKIKASQSYKSQWSTTKSGGYYFSKEVMKGLMRARGAQFGVEYAEAFEVYHLKL
ncbi:MAG TPA: PIG-L family deacetylase [Ignavibacteria bacterium]|nr:PIG-L family deacetylase [Ignavibacteria bacterium]HMQ99171.1 PIG-L family deacetylase [Ignavibacteria bacterium]